MESYFMEPILNAQNFILMYYSLSQRAHAHF